MAGGRLEKLIPEQCNQPWITLPAGPRCGAGRFDDARKAGAGERGEIDAMTAVIRGQVNKREYVSRHLTGHALDVRTPEDRRAFEQVVQEVLGSLRGHLIEDGPGGERHFHVQFDR